MSTALLLTQALLAALFVAAGAPKLLLPKERLASTMRWTKTAPAFAVKLLGLAELLGAAGLVLPGALGVATFLTPLAAGCLFVLLLGAVATKVRFRESPALPVVAALASLAVLRDVPLGLRGLEPCGVDGSRAAYGRRRALGGRRRADVRRAVTCAGPPRPCAATGRGRHYARRRRRDGLTSRRAHGRGGRSAPSMCRIVSGSRPATSRRSISLRAPTQSKIATDGALYVIART